jgi:hypothetical protein
MNSTLETALCLAQKFDSYVEGFALRGAIPAAYAMADAAAGTIPTLEQDIAENAKQTRGLFESFMQEHGRQAGWARPRRQAHRLSRHRRQRPGVTAQLECLLDDVVVGKQEMVGAIDAVCCVAERIIGKLTKSAGTIQKTAREIGLRRYDRPPATVVSARMQR